MKFTCTVDINLPMNRVLELWLDESNNHAWQDGFKSKELIEGNQDEIGSKYRIILEQGNRKMELIETLLSNDLPKERKSLVEHIHMDNTQLVRFEAISDEKTRYVSEIEYIKFKHFVPRIMAKLFPKMFKTQVQKWLDQFKTFAEA